MLTRVTTIGGGTGSFVLLSGLKNYPYQLTALVTVTDDGGSTGRLRNEFGFLPVGDLRQCIAALADDDQDKYLTKLLLYRFSKGQGLTGHNLGNLILTALRDIYGSETKALEIVNKIFHLKGKIYPISLKPVKLKASYSSGQTIISEHLIEEHKLAGREKIINLSSQPQTLINPLAQKAILDSQFIILGPGDLYGSTIANLVIGQVSQTINQSSAKLIMIMNLMTLKSQTQSMTAKNHLLTLEKYLTRKVDYIVVNNQKIEPHILALYAELDEYPVEDDLSRDKRVIRVPLLDKKKHQKSSSDALKRSLLRHQPQKLAEVIHKIIND